MSRAQLTSTVEQNTGGAVSPYVAGKNFVINGGFDIWQRGTAVATIGSNNGVHYLADRWCSNGYQDTRMQRIALGYQNANLNSQYAMRNSSCTTAQISFGTRMRSSQKIESVNSYLLAGKTVTVSYWVKFSAATISSSTATAYGNWFGNLDYYTTTTDGNHDTVLPDSQSTANYPFTNGTFPTTWTKVSYTATIPTGVNNVGVSFGFDNLGNTASADTAYYDLAQVQLEIGSVATPFSRAGGTLSGELQACQRYYWRTPQPVGSSDRISVFGTCTSTTEQRVVVQHPVPMRLAPTTIDYASLRAYDGAGFPTVTSIAITSTTPLYSEVVSVGTGLTAYRPTAYAVTATTGYFGFTAEL